MNKKLKLVIIGVGLSYILELFKYIILNYEDLKVIEIVLVDLEDN